MTRTRARAGEPAPAHAFSGHGDRPGTPGAPPRRRSPAAATAAAGAAVLLLFCYCVVMYEWVLVEPGSASPRSAPQRHLTLGPTSGAAPIEYPEAGDGTWRTAAGAGDVAGASGTRLRLSVAVETSIVGVDTQQFAARVLATLADPRGWTAGGLWRFQLVSGTDQPDFTVYLATPATRDRLCESEYDRYTSCRAGDRVVLNVARWAHGVPNYPAGLRDYQEYLVNHEVGHRIGYGHELCPGPGEPAPVMQQQTLGLHGCTPNSWVYRGGDRYAGPPGEYDDPVPA